MAIESIGTVQAVPSRRRWSTAQTRAPYLVGINNAAGAEPPPQRVLRRRETYTGPWLPEPLVTAPDVAEDVELAERVSLAMMLVLETLTPLERAVFVLR